MKPRLMERAPGFIGKAMHPGINECRVSRLLRDVPLVRQVNISLWLNLTPPFWREQNYALCLYDTTYSQWLHLRRQ